MNTLVSKYNVPGPRYTSYPTVPYWDPNSFSISQWEETLKKSVAESNITEGISLYIHLPYCEQMCTFCGCNKRITKNHDVEIPYIQSVLKELELYVTLFEEKPIIKQIHLGGGTPTFFSPENIDDLIKGIFVRVIVAQEVEFSFEGHPNNTTENHLRVLAHHGFTRVCYGVQDYNEEVQKAIHRIQPFEKVKWATEKARVWGYSSVGHDVIYGLPFQSLSNVINTIEKTISLRPDRIAFYSYAHVPWIKGNGQRGFSERDLPTATQKKEQYAKGKQMLKNAGYFEIGMDHFALPTDALYKAQLCGSLHRNFMGYMASKTQVMIGLGVSSISDSWYSFAQNVKKVEDYLRLVDEGILPVFRGHVLTGEDLTIRQHILNVMCQFETSWSSAEGYFPELPMVLKQLEELQKDGLITMDSQRLSVTEKGKAFVRNVCMSFDLRLKRNLPKTQLFSMTV